jgi:fluoride exporter
VRTWALIGAGGAIGGLARYGVDQALAFTPWATLAVNVLGCLAIGIVIALVAGRTSAPFWIAGVLGGFTTFSAFAVEAVLLLLDDQVGWALAYVGATLILGLLAVPLGERLARRT